MGLLNINNAQSLQQLHRHWVEEALQRDQLRNPTWSESIAVGSEAFVEYTKKQLKSRANHHKCQPVTDGYQLKEPGVTYQVHLASDKAQLRMENSYLWDNNLMNTIRWLGPTPTTPQRPPNDPLL